MKTNIILFLTFAVSLGACKKNDEDSPTTSTGDSNFEIIEYVGEFDFGSIDCSDKPSIEQRNATHLFVNGCNRIYRYDKNFVPVDWIGFDGNGSFGIHDLSDQSTQITGYIYLNGLNNTHAYIRHQYDGWADDSLIVIEFSTGQTSALTSDELNEFNFWVQSDGTIFRSDYDDANAQNVMKKYNKDGVFVEDIPIPGKLTMAGRLIKLDSEDNFFILQGIQTVDFTPPIVTRFSASFSKELEFSTDLREQYIPNFAVSDENIIYVEDMAAFRDDNSSSGFFTKSECYAYDREGKLLHSYTINENGQRLWMDIVFNKKILTYGNDNAWKVWSIPE